MLRAALIGLLMALPLAAIAQDLDGTRAELINSYRRMDLQIYLANGVSKSSLIFADAMGGQTKANVYNCVSLYQDARTSFGAKRADAISVVQSKVADAGSDADANAKYLREELPIAEALEAEASQIKWGAFNCLTSAGVRVDLLLEEVISNYEHQNKSTE